MSENFVLSLEIMGKGMLGVFAAALIIWFAVWVMQKAGGRNKKR